MQSDDIRNGVIDILEQYSSIVKHVSTIEEYVEYNKNVFDPIEYYINKESLYVGSDLYFALEGLNDIIPKIIKNYKSIGAIREEYYSNPEVYCVIMLLVKQKTIIRDAITYIENKDIEHAATKVASLYRAFKCVEVVSCKTQTDKMFFIDSLIAYNSILDQITVHIN